MQQEHKYLIPKLERNLNIYKTFKEGMSFSLLKAKQVSVETKREMSLREFFDKTYDISHIRFSVSRDAITNEFQFFYYKNKKSAASVDNVKIGGASITNFEKPQYVNLTLSNFSDSNKLSSKKDFKTMWPISFDTRGNETKIELISHTSLKGRKFYIPPGKTIKLMTIKNIDFLISEEHYDFTKLISYDVVYITAPIQDSNTISSPFKIRFSSNERIPENRHYWSNKMFTWSFNNDVHPTKLKGLELKTSKELNYSLDESGVKIIENSYDDIFYKHTIVYEGNYIVKDKTSYNYNTEETQVDNSSKSRLGYVIPYSFSGEMNPEAKFSFNDNLKDIYISTSIKRDRPLLNPQIGVVRTDITETKPSGKYEHNFLIPNKDIETLFQKSEISTSFLSRWELKK